jgi:peptide/nickel transport system permease protein
MSRWSYFAKRALLSIPVLFSVMTILFVLLRLGPLSPVAARLGENPQGADIEQMRENLGLNDPLWDQYVDFMVDLVTFQGESWVVRTGQPVGEAILNLAPATIWLGFWAILLPLFIGIPLAFYAGLNPNTKGDYLASTMGILWQSMPNFWLSVMALAVLRQTHGGGIFGFNWYTLGPNIPSVTGTPQLNFFGSIDLLGLSIPFITDWAQFFADFKLILPGALILGSASMAAELRIGRTAILETVNSKYVETARRRASETGSSSGSTSSGTP